MINESIFSDELFDRLARHFQAIDLSPGIVFQTSDHSCVFVEFRDNSVSIIFPDGSSRMSCRDEVIFAGCHPDGLILRSLVPTGILVASAKALSRFPSGTTKHFKDMALAIQNIRREYLLKFEPCEASMKMPDVRMVPLPDRSISPIQDGLCFVYEGSVVLSSPESSLLLNDGCWFDAKSASARNISIVARGETTLVVLRRASKSGFENLYLDYGTWTNREETDSIADHRTDETAIRIPAKSTRPVIADVPGDVAIESLSSYILPNLIKNDMRTPFAPSYFFWLLQLALKHSRISAILFAFTALLILATFISAQINQIAFSFLSSHNPVQKLTLMAAALAFSSLSAAAIDFMKEVVDKSLLLSVDSWLRHLYLGRLLNQSSARLTLQSAGVWLNRYLALEQIKGVFSRIFKKSLLDLVTLSILVAYTASKLPPLLAVFSVLFLVSSAINFLESRYIRAIYPKIIDASTQLETEVLDQISNILQVKALHLGAVMRARFERLFDNTTKYGLLLERRALILGFAASAVDFSIKLASIWVCVDAANHGLVQPSLLITLLFFLDPIISSVNSLAGSIPLAAKSVLSMKQTPEVVRHFTEHKRTNLHIADFRDVSFHDVGFYYPGESIPAIHALNFRLIPGQTLAIIGRSGSGKSTIAKLLGLACEPSIGTILIGGVPAHRLQASDVRRKIAVVEQDTKLIKGTLLENVAAGYAEIDLEWAIRCIEAAELDNAALKRTRGLDQEIIDNGKGLSEGQRQRLAIARALYRQPDVLVLDEATAGVDSPTEVSIYQRIRKLLPNSSLILITHRLSNVQYSDGIMMLENGKMAGYGSHEELLSGCEPYRKLYESVV